MAGNKHNLFGAALIATLCVIALAAGPVRASSVVDMPLPVLADYAGQVIMGTVASVRSYPVDGPNGIESAVFFDHVEYLKGKLPDADNRFTLTVPGGQVGRRRLTVCCAPTFAEGQKWLLFLLPEYKTFPVVGLYQGAFLIEPDSSGVERVSQVSHGHRMPVRGIGVQGFVRTLGPAHTHASDRLKSATNLRPIIAEATDESDEQILSLDAFLDTVRPIIDASKHHALTAPAGKPAAVAQAAVPMRAAAGADTAAPQNDKRAARSAPIIKRITSEGRNP